MRNIEYRIGSLKSKEKQITSFMIVNELLPEEWYLNMRSKTQVIWGTRSIYITWKAAIQNHKALLNFVGDYNPDVSVAQEMHLLSCESQNATITLAQLITNCIVSFTTFLTVTEKNLTKNSKSSVHLELWNKKRKDLHSHSFSYRLGYELRNYSQHYEIPINEVVFTMRDDSVTQLQAYAESIRLLDGSYNWKSLKNELRQEKNSRIDLMQLLQEYLACINEIYINTLDVYLEEVVECRNFILELCIKHEIDEDSHPVVFKGAIVHGTKLPREKEFIPLYLLNQMRRDWIRELNYDIAISSMPPPA